MISVEAQYRLMYRLGITPWDRDSVPAELTHLIEGAGALPPGLALDIGCGSGRDATYLSDHGWRVTGLDVSARAIDAARRRSSNVDWHVGGLGAASLEPVIERLTGQVTFVLDVGCLHGLGTHGRAAWAATVNRVAAPGALVGTPRGIDPTMVSALLGPDWSPGSRSPKWALHVRSKE